MRQNRVLLFRIAAAMAVLTGSGTTWATKPINLLLMGDSITAQGYYNNPLETLLRNNGYAPNVLANEGHSGSIIQGNIPGAPRSGLEENINSYMNHAGVNASNNYILLMIGTNDVDTGFNLLSTAVPNVRTRLGGLISSIESIAPQAHLIVAEITPQPYRRMDVQNFNLDVVATVRVAGGNVSVVDMYDAFSPSLYQPYTSTPSPYMADYLHPNQAGGNIMAQVWFNGIQAIQAPEPPTSVLLTSGLLALLTYAWRKRSKPGVAHADGKR